MRIRLTKLDDRQHRLEVVRADGTTAERVLDTRSFLVHDLAHYAIEAERGSSGGVWGHLARGVSWDDLTAGVVHDPDELARCESLVGPFQSLWAQRLSRERYAAVAGVEGEFVEGALARMRRLVGHWNATARGTTMELPWPP